MTMELAGRVLLVAAFAMAVLGTITVSGYAARRQKPGDVMGSTALALQEILRHPRTHQCTKTVLALAATGAILWLLGQLVG